MEKTIFAKIASHEIPAHIVWEDQDFIAFLDILPMAPGHVIVIPKEAYPSLEAMPVNLLGSYLTVVQRVGAAIFKSLNVKGYRLFMDNVDKSATASEHILHVHFHVVPRSEGDGLDNRSQGTYDDGQAEEYEQKIKAALI